MLLRTEPNGYNGEVDALLQDVVEGITLLLGKNLAGIYLLGSLTYDDFRPERSDVDLVAVVQRALNETELDAIEQMHAILAAEHPVWGRRLEVSYTPVAMFASMEPPAEPRPWYGFDVLYREAPYGNEWLINNHLLGKHGVVLVGPEFASLAPLVPIELVQCACIADLHTEWLPKRNDVEWMADPHQASYLVLNLCRILYTVLCAEAGSKSKAAAWVAQAYPPWMSLVLRADQWAYGMEWTRQDRAETLAFLDFVASEVGGSEAARRCADAHVAG